MYVSPLINMLDTTLFFLRKKSFHSSFLCYCIRLMKKNKKLAVYLDSRENHEGKKINIFSIKDFFCMPGLGIFIQLDI